MADTVRIPVRARVKRRIALAVRPPEVTAACYAPFTSLWLDTQGNARACCFNDTYILGNVTRERLSDIWHGSRMEALRAHMVDGDYSLGCQQCAWQGSEGTEGYVYARVYDRLRELSTDPPPWPIRLEMSLSNACNLQCQMCSGILSSSIRAHREHLPPLPKAYDDQFFDDLREFVPHLREATFAGGEPFMARECFRVWDLFIELNPAIRCTVTTNGTHWNPKVERVLDELPVHVNISIDGITPETFEAIRIGADFDKVMTNLERFRERAVSMHVITCFMPQNAHEVPEVIKLADSLGLGLSIHYVTTPTSHSIDALPVERRQEILADLEAKDAEMADTLVHRKDKWDELVARVRRSVEEGYEGYDEFVGARVLGFASVGRPSSDESTLDRTVATWIGQGATEASIGRVRVDYDEVITSVSPSTCTLLSTSETELLGRPFSRLMEVAQEQFGPAGLSTEHRRDDAMIESETAFGDVVVTSALAPERDDLGHATGGVMAFRVSTNR